MIKKYYHLTLHRFFKVLGFTAFFETRYGIKAYNKSRFRVNSDDHDTVTVSPKDVYLGFDGLKDSCTLTDTPLSLSPHYELVQLLKAGGDISDCDYIKRFAGGYLDGRVPADIDTNAIADAFISSSKKIEDGDYPPPVLYKAGDRLYVIDGKHRLATALLMGIDLNCVIIDPSLFKSDSYTRGLYDKMCKRRSDYSKNLLLMDRFM